MICERMKKEIKIQKNSVFNEYINEHKGYHACPPSKYLNKQSQTNRMLRVCP
jgi:hypothetical protein